MFNKETRSSVKVTGSSCLLENHTLGVWFRKAYSDVLKMAPLGVKINFGSPTKFKYQGGTHYVFRLKQFSTYKMEL